LFVTATPEVRARRRCEELQRMGLAVHFEDVLIDIRARDERDSNRAAAPLQAAPDAHRLDTSEMDVEAAVGEAIALVERRLS
jgi:cytidylate kinase